MSDDKRLFTLFFFLLVLLVQFSLKVTLMKVKTN